MENKEQLNQNPEDNNAQPQEANSNSELKTEEISNTSEEVTPPQDKKPKPTVESEVPETTDKPEEAAPQEEATIVAESTPKESTPKPKEKKEVNEKEESVSEDASVKPEIPEAVAKETEEPKVIEADAVVDEAIDETSTLETPQSETIKEPKNKEEIKPDSKVEEVVEVKAETDKAIDETSKLETPQPEAIKEPEDKEETKPDSKVEEVVEVKAETDKAIDETSKLETPQPETIKETEDKEEIKPDSKVEEVVEVKAEMDEDVDETVGTVSAKEDDVDDEVEDEVHDEEDHEGEEDSAKPKVDYNTLSREELVNILEETVEDDDINAIKKEVALIKVAFLRKNKEEQDKKLEDFVEDGEETKEPETTIDEITIKFNGAFKIYKEKRKAFLEELEKTKQKNLEAKKIILEELKAMIDSEESLKKTYDEFKVLQDKWKEIGMVPKNEVNNLWQNYHFYVEKFFDKVKINKELRDLDLKKNLETKVVLCEKVEELLLESSILKSFKQLQKYHQEYKETGPVPQDKKDEVWERFKNATDKINDRRREHYEKLQETQKTNLVAKTALCEKAEEVLQIENNSIKEWQSNTDSITELLKVWKTLGPAPRKQNDEIWERFKGSLDAFFAGKKEFFQNIKDEQLNNYNLKLDLCTQAEALKTSTEWRQTTQDLINLQKEWKNIGPVPRKHSDKIWKRFRASCDEFFNSKSNFYANIGKHETENQKLKEDLIKNISEYKFEDNKNDNLNVLKDFQRQWMEIGHVPIKEKDRLQDEFRNTINKHYDQLNINKAEVQAINYKQRMENLKDNPNSKRIISNERSFLQNKMKKLEEEINLWENNIGFLAASKKASLLKEEFEKKIDAGKDELKVLKEKLKFLEREAR